METSRGLIVFGSTTGTTRLLAGAVKAGLCEAGLDVVVRNAAQVRPAELVRYPVVVFGCSTWEDGHLQKDFRRLRSELGDLRLDGVLGAVFGPGSRSYPLFCKAVDVLEEEFHRRGARLVLPSFRVDGSAYGVRGAVRSWAEGIRRFL
jgi:flavodoxin I